MAHHASRITHHAESIHDSRFTFWVVSLVLTMVYALTLAPGVTLWDAGEFNAAIASLGIPHPPGTPLYILIANAWANALGIFPQALAVNLLSAVATAVACGLLGGLMARWTQSRLAGIAAGLTAGSMLAVWNNATETEVYAISFLLAVLLVVVGDRAGERESTRWPVLLAYLIGLAVPVQVSALVAAPAAILLASSGRGSLDWRRAMALGAALLIVVGVAMGSSTLALAGVVAAMASVMRSGRRQRLEAVAFVVVAAVGMSATLFMLLRAPFDPYVNQGNPSGLSALLDVVTRQQYDVPGIWPRRAPIWIQLGNFLQYADWQVASGVHASVAASWWRTPFSVMALLVAIAGGRWLWRADRRGGRGMGVLLLVSSLGVVAVLNLRAGPSISDAVLPAGATHEPRERDYFFALAFATVGACAGAGAVRLARHWLAAWPRAVAPAAMLVAGLPVVLNWRAANRRPDAMIAPTLGESLLASTPPNAVLLLAGDNDSYTTWYRQAVLGERPDVAPVTVSLLPAGWYREELARRHQLLDVAHVAQWRGAEATVRALVNEARAEGRPIAAAVTVDADFRRQLAPAWTLGGMVFVAEPGPLRPDRVDSAMTRRVADLVAARIPKAAKPRDPATGYVLGILRCPAHALRLGIAIPEATPDGLLDSYCNFK